MFLVSSNHRKLAEFARYGLDLDLRPGADLPEVAGSPEDVAVHKALAAGPGAVVEDTILLVDGEPWVDIKWTLDALRDHTGAPTVWRVTLAHHDGEVVRVFVGEVAGHLVCPERLRAEAFGFDPFFQPEGYSQTLDELERAGRKDETSARRRAAEALLANRPVAVRPVADIPAWSGAWQASGPRRPSGPPKP